MSSAHTHVVPASPSWYCSQVLDCSPAGIACYGAKNTVFVWDVERDPPVCLAHFSAHQDRVVGLSLSPSTNQLQCCTAGEDGRVRVWNIEDGSMLKEHNIHAENHKKPTCVQWSPLVSDLIISGDDRGTVVLWWTETDQQRSLLPENAHIFCFACSPHDPNLLAIGYRTGAVVIIDMSKKTQMTVQRLKGHDEEIHSICWCPVPAENEKDPTPTTGCLLATGSRDRTIRVWSFTRGRPVHVMKLPTNTGYSRGRYDDQSKNRAWVTILWLKNEPYKLLSSSFNGELIQWDLSQPKPQWKLFTAGDKALGHNRIVFNMAAGGSDSKILIVTWDLDTLKSKRSIPTLGGFVYCMAHSPFQPGCVALGVGDNMIRIWKTDHPDNSLSIQSHWQGIRSKVTALAWHPKKEGKLAYGTDDGRVGIMDTLSHKSPLISSSYHKHTVYVVAWGPVCSGEKPECFLAIFVCIRCLLKLCNFGNQMISLRVANEVCK
ncbi:hypothetical protein CAPTEDRAFT_189953 [Capitella teleta]|uniref:Gem-associated protein 5 first beta-propeller domain-containing protein n=1 Tax=Capitella teleta TaxID=283909 RepID=R7UB86_CAPTE|nr:hypothetical protein CAPTEDRAFT_189953 [Capitella teleta]|eukprot:ELU01058.1 hypothetical protein CAPTEDRAFT_189953 [Capitella teleta]